MRWNALLKMSFHAVYTRSGRHSLVALLSYNNWRHFSKDIFILLWRVRVRVRSLPPKLKSIRPSHERGKMTGPRANVMTKSPTLTENDTQTAEHRWRKEQVNCNWRWLIKMCIISITHICDMSWLMTGNDTRHATQKILDPRRLTPEGPHISGQKHLSINRSYSLGSVREIGSKPRQGNIMSRAFSWGG